MVIIALLSIVDKLLVNSADLNAFVIIGSKNILLPSVFSIIKVSECIFSIFLIIEQHFFFLLEAYLVMLIVFQYFSRKLSPNLFVI